jgi:hypothetical protein
LDKIQRPGNAAVARFGAMAGEILLLAITVL